MIMVLLFMVGHAIGIDTIQLRQNCTQGTYAHSFFVITVELFVYVAELAKNEVSMC